MDTWYLKGSVSLGNLSLNLGSYWGKIGSPNQKRNWFFPRKKQEWRLSLLSLLEVYSCLFHPSCKIKHAETCKYRCTVYVRVYIYTTVNKHTHAVTHLYMYYNDRRCWSVSEVRCQKGMVGWQLPFFFRILKRLKVNTDRTVTKLLSKIPRKIRIPDSSDRKALTTAKSSALEVWIYHPW